MATTKTTSKRAARPASKKAARPAKKATRKATKTAGRAAKSAKRSVKKAANKTTKATRTTARTTVRKAARSAKSTSRRTAVSAGRSTAGARTAARATRTSTSTARRSARGSSTDAIALLKQDHREVEQLFKRFEKSGSGARAAKRALVSSMIEALSVHAEIEEMVFYPAVRANVPRVADDVLEAREEHHVVKVVLRELEDMDPTAERFEAKVTVMMELVRHHVREEEAELFPKVRNRISRRDLVDLGDQLRDAKRIVPTRPHPSAPDEPPANALVGGAVAAMDRARGVGKRALDRVREEIPGM